MSLSLAMGASRDDSPVTGHDTDVDEVVVGVVLRPRGGGQRLPYFPTLPLFNNTHVDAFPTRGAGFLASDVLSKGSVTQAMKKGGQDGISNTYGAPVGAGGGGALIGHGPFLRRLLSWERGRIATTDVVIKSCYLLLHVADELGCACRLDRP